MSESDDTDALAAEYALGVLDGADRSQASLRARTEPAFAALVAAWENWLGPLAVLVPPVAPPPALWTRLSASIDGAAARSSVPVRLRGGSVRVWQGATAAALALAAAFATLAYLPRAPQAGAVAALAPIGSPAPAFVVRALPGGRLQLVSLGHASVPAGRDLELWALPAGAKAPVSLGVLPADGAIIAAGPLTAPGGQLLVSLEPKGGSPTGQPTGAVLYGGRISRS